MSIAAGDEEGGENEGEASKASVVFVEEAPTLTIKGQGDLTTYTTTDWSARVFTDKAVGFVFTDNNGTKTSVTEGAHYQSATTYYSPEYTYTELTGEAIGSNGQPVGWKTPFGNVTTTTAWKESVSTTYLYECYYNNNANNPGVVISNKNAVTTTSTVNTTNTYTYNDNTYSYYIKSDKALTESDWDGSANIYFSDFETKGVTALTPDALKEYYTSVCTYPMSFQTGSYFVSHDGGTTKIGLANGQTYTYQDGDKFYSATATYNKIEDNAKHFTDESGLIKADPTSVSVAQLLLRKLKGATYTTVKFENTGTDDLLIDNGIVQTILYYEGTDGNSKNTDLTTLDLGATTLKGFSGAAFVNSNATYTASQLKLTTLTLPKTDKMTTGEGDDAVTTMTVPTSILTYNNASLSSVKEIIIPEGYTHVGELAFGGATENMVGMDITSVTFPSTLKEIGKRAFANCNYLTAIELNEGLTYVGKEAFQGIKGLTAVTFPSTLDKIDDAAFDGCSIHNLKFNAGLRFIGNSAFSLPSEQTEKTIEIPASVRYIGPAAFNFRQYQDVYFLGKNAPLMPMGDACTGKDVTNVTAFSSNTQMGNNGFVANATEGTVRENTQTGYANRENYHGNAAYFCILHYPAGLTTDEANKYQDQTRVYLTKTENFSSNDTYTAGQEEDGHTWTIYGSMSSPTKDVNYGYQDTYLGAQYVWPSQSQWGRAYVVASNGYNWNGKDKYQPEFLEGEVDLLKEAGFNVTDSNLDSLKTIAHLGTRMFVLGNTDSYVDPEPEEEPEYPVVVKKGKYWWTICLPFNMTKAQVTAVFGEGTHVCRFNAVDRSEKDGVKKITLRFQKDVYVHKFVKTAETSDGTVTYKYEDANSTVADDDVVIYAHEAYMIYPTNNPDAETGKFTIKGYELEVGSPNPTIVKANASDTSEDADHKEYRYIGNYQTTTTETTKGDDGQEIVTTHNVWVPQYSYMYAKKNGDSAHKFWFWAGTTGVQWNANKCVVQATAKDGGSADYSDFFGGNTDNAKQVTLLGDAEDETTAIEEITIIAGEGDDAQVVYNLNGQPVSRGSLSGLARGIYIQNGKKFVVK